MKKHVKTKTELAKILNLSRPTLRKYLDLPDAPKPNQDGYDLGKVAKFIAERGDREATLAKGSKDIAALKAREISLRCERMSFKIQRERGEYVKVSDVAAAITRILPQANAILEQKLVHEWPSAVAGLDVAQARIYGRRLADDIRKAMQGLSREFPER